MGFRDVLRGFGRVFSGSEPVSLGLVHSEAKSYNVIVDETGFVQSRLIPQSLRSLGTEGLTSNVVMAPVMWVMRTFTEAQAVVERREQDNIWKPVIDHEIEQLIDRPNDSYDGDALWKATSLSYVINGNAYWRKVRNVYGDVVQLWYIPHWLMRPMWSPDGTTFITHYEYATGIGQPVPLAPRDVVHFRFGLDPENVRLGLSPLRSLLREVCTDDEAARFSEKILENMGVPGLVISPKDASGAPMSPEAVAKLKEQMRASFSGAHRGEALVMGRPTEVAQFGFDPNKLMLGGLRDIAEERVCAVMGIPAAVVGFGAGIQSTRVGATMREMRRLAWVQCLTPMQKSLAKQLTAQLLPDFVSQTRRFRVRFDTSDVSAFQEEDDLRATRISKLVLSGILRVDRAQDMLGLEVDPTQRVYLRPTTTTPDGPDAPTVADGDGADAEDDPADPADGAVAPVNESATPDTAKHDQAALREIERNIHHLRIVNS